MSIAPSALSRFSLSASFAFWLVLGAGCSSEPHPDKSAALAGGVPDYPAVMSGTEMFANGSVGVEVTLGLPTDFRPGKDEGRKGGGHSGSGHHGGRRGGGGMGMSGGGYPGVEGSADRPEGTSGDDGPSVMGSTLPPAQLKLHLSNPSTTDVVTCEVVDFNSYLGNFAVYPSTYKIEAGQSIISETMTSRMGVEGSDIPVTVALRVKGQVEKKVVTLHLISAAEKPAAPLPAK